MYVLYRLVCPNLKSGRAKMAVILVSMLGVALLCADAIFTPAVRYVPRASSHPVWAESVFDRGSRTFSISAPEDFKRNLSKRSACEVLRCCNSAMSDFYINLVSNRAWRGYNIWLRVSDCLCLRQGGALNMPTLTLDQTD